MPPLLRFLSRIAFLSLLVGPVYSQELDVPKAYDLGVKAMESGKYDEGIASIDAVLSQHGETGKAKYGAVFGHFHYLKGMLLVKKKNYVAAIESFKACARDFQNDPGETFPNCFIAEALAQWGGCLMTLKDYSTAATLYREALALEEIHVPQLNRIEAQVNLSKCLMLAGNPGQGKDFITKNLDDSNATDAMKRSLFLILLGDWSPGAPLTEINSFMTKYKNLLDGDDLTGRTQKQNPVFLRLATDALESKDPNRALYWYDRMTPPMDAAKSVSDQITKLKDQAARTKAEPGSEETVRQTEASIATLEAASAELRTQYSDMLLGRGSAHYAAGNLNEAIRSYVDFEKGFPSHEERPVILHNLTMCAINLSRWDVATRYGMQFFKEYPNHELKPAMAQTLADSLFVQGNYEEAYRIADQLVQDFKPGTPAADIPTFVAAASLFHLGRFEDAEKNLTDYLNRYSSGQRIEAARYYLGAVKANLQKWDETVASLDLFLEGFKDSVMRPAALNLSAISYMMIRNFPMANSRIIELQVKHPAAAEIPNSYNLLGDVLAAREKPWSEVVETYQKALDMVEKHKRGDENVAGYALRQLIITTAKAERWENAAGHYDHFSQKYEASTWRDDVRIAAVKALVKSGRQEEAERMLVDFVKESVGHADSTRLDQAFGTFVRFLQNHHDPDEALRKIRAFPAGPTSLPPALQAWLYMSEIELLPDRRKEDGAATEAEMGALFKKLNQLYDEHGTQLSNQALVKLAVYNSQNGENVAQARKIYEFIVTTRPGGEAAVQAQVDLAKLEAVSPTPANRQNARVLFLRILNEVDDPSAQEQAVLGMARLEMNDGKFGEARKWWEQYRGTPDWNEARAEASFQYGACLRELGERDEAAAIFVNVYANFPGQLDWSTRAYIETAKIIRSKGNDIDALKLLREMLQRMSELDHPGITEGKELFFKWREDYSKKPK